VTDNKPFRSKPPLQEFIEIPTNNYLRSYSRG
jgi:hypothetical protein